MEIYMLDREIAESIGLPASTLAKWKHADTSDWRKTFYIVLTTKPLVRKIFIQRK